MVFIFAFKQVYHSAQTANSMFLNVNHQSPNSMKKHFNLLSLFKISAGLLFLSVITLLKVFCSHYGS